MVANRKCVKCGLINSAAQMSCRRCGTGFTDAVMSSQAQAPASGFPSGLGASALPASSVPRVVAPPPAAAPGPAAPALGFAPAPVHERLVDVMAPRPPDRANPLFDPSKTEIATRVKAGVGGIVFGVVAGGLLYYFDLIFWSLALGGFFTLVGVLSIFGRNHKWASCPFCTERVDNIAPRSRSPKRCQKCGEYSSVGDGQLRAYAPDTVANTPTFESFLYADTHWPRACVLCGAPPTRLDELSSNKINAGYLIVGTLRISSTTLRGVPYCDAHKDAVTLFTTGGVRLRWRSLPMLRRYLAANRGQLPYK